MFTKSKTFNFVLRSRRLVLLTFLLLLAASANSVAFFKSYIILREKYDPVLRPRGPPPEWVGSTQAKGKKQYVSLCRSLTTRITCIHTYTQTIHTPHILTYKYIHTPIHACTYRHAPPTHRGGAGGRPLVTEQPPCTYRPLCTHTLWWGGGGASRAGSYMEKENKNAKHSH